MAHVYLTKEQWANTHIPPIVTYKGVRMVLTKWATKLGVPYSLLRYHVEQKKRPAEAVLGFFHGECELPPIPPPPVKPHLQDDRVYLDYKKPEHRFYLVLDGQKVPLIRWARKQGISYVALMRRMKRGWSQERILATPVRKYKGSLSRKRADLRLKQLEEQARQDAQAGSAQGSEDPPTKSPVRKPRRTPRAGN